MAMVRLLLRADFWKGDGRDAILHLSLDVFGLILRASQRHNSCERSGGIHLCCERTCRGDVHAQHSPPPGMCMNASVSPVIVEKFCWTSIATSDMRPGNSKVAVTTPPSLEMQVSLAGLPNANVCLPWTKRALGFSLWIRDIHRRVSIWG